MNTTVRTKQGLIEGFSEDGIYKFLGVPYAKPLSASAVGSRLSPRLNGQESERLETSARYVLRLPARYLKREPNARVKIAFI